ncbi:glycerate kinase type-2 family protein [Rubrivirga sp.]|uniref:glycerate kinase type-2 family protein n=1 Tax=Rubrivirga sp. TaxID=1885344 RepID=UPI003B5216BB
MHPDDALARDARRVFGAAVRSVQAPVLLRDVDLDAVAGRPIRTFGRVVVVGAGKASIPLAGALDARLADVPVEGAVVVPAGYPATVPNTTPRPARIEVVEGGHPVPTPAGARAAAEALALAGAAGPDDLVLVLLSGGGSALWTLPPPGVSLADLRATTRLLLAAGVPIDDVNTVRKHLSRIAGGRLALAAAPARVVALVISDVVGDDPAVIASGPTVPDPTTADDALGVLDAAGLLGRVPPAVRARLAAEGSGERPASPGPGHPAFRTATTLVIGTNGTALDAAAREAERLGYAVVGRSSVEGEAREVGRRVAETVRGADARATCRLWGGETTVAVTGAGRGGRNQEVALAAALALDGADTDAVVLSLGTDGVDGPTDAAGGWASPHTAGRIRAAGLDPAARLADNDAYAALDAAGALVRTGPTHTNVADVIVAMTAGTRTGGSPVEPADGAP